MKAPRIRHPFTPNPVAPRECVHCGCREDAHLVIEDSLMSWQRRLTDAH